MSSKFRSCPGCRAMLDSDICHTKEGAEPRPGDLSVCRYCCAPMIYLRDRSRRLLTRAEIAELPADLQRRLRTVMLQVGAA